ncbi:hypothetical protein J4Q44_G00020860 [Coregonus suidteri]|uniref:Uncharacterized protein n=1 Tax=Coregonus suidteri TaxID=861788 RepID=A0AAN8MGS1_9TELE
MVCTDIGVQHCKLPTWSRVGMDITPDELRKVVERTEEEYNTSILDSITMPDVGCTILALGVAFLVVCMVHMWLSKRKWTRQGQGKGGLLQCQAKGDSNKALLMMELQEKVLLRMEGMEQRLDAMEDFLSCMGNKRTMEKTMYGKQEAAGDKSKRDALRFSDCSDNSN